MQANRRFACPSLCAAARARKLTFASELPTPFQFLRVARRALQSLDSAADHQRNGSQWNRPNRSAHSPPAGDQSLRTSGTPRHRATQCGAETLDDLG